MRIALKSTVVSKTLLYFSYSCVKDRVYRLCKDCDVVFHKSAIKRRHVRLPVILIKSLKQLPSNSLHPTDDEQLPSEVYCLSLNELVNHSGDIIDYISSLSMTEAISKTEFREATSCLLVEAVIRLLDDRKVRD